MPFSRKRKYGSRLRKFASPYARKTRRTGKGVFVKGAVQSFGGRKELKYVDYNFYTVGLKVDTTGDIKCVNLIGEGDSNITRDGRIVMMESVQISGIIGKGQATCNSECCRVMLVWDNAPNNAAIPTIANILGAAPRSFSFPDVDQQQRYTILLDKKIALGAVTATAAESLSCVCLDQFVKVHKATQYSTLNADQAALLHGALYLITIGDQAPGAGHTLACAVRTRFTDI